MEKKKITVTIEGPDENGNFELTDVPGYRKIDLEEKGGVKLTKMGSVNIYSANIESSPGHWCLVDRRYIWCPD
jgi:hypothetical protein